MARNWKQLVYWAMILVAIVGVFIAITNLPVVTGCGYYGRCGASVIAE